MYVERPGSLLADSAELDPYSPRTIRTRSEAAQYLCPRPHSPSPILMLSDGVGWRTLGIGLR